MIHKSKWITLLKNCRALRIPDAVPFTIPIGTQLQITQSMGGAITVAVEGQLARIEAKNADALGLEIPNKVLLDYKHNQNNEVIGPVNINRIWDVLRTCYDPEIPVNIVDLGLIYHCEVTSTPDMKSNHVTIQMTLTAPGCSMGPIISSDAKQKVLASANVTDVTIDIVFEPIWTQDRMSDAAKLELGLL